jgi:hypothetical protein
VLAKSEWRLLLMSVIEKRIHLRICFQDVTVSGKIAGHRIKKAAGNNPTHRVLYLLIIPVKIDIEIMRFISIQARKKIFEPLIVNGGLRAV